ncbi:MAG: hypothetical protein JOY76_04065 [Hyphomicrobiales bacterium]|nr:hypothetical protein [Hyphomicrobiales bacterium]MBV8427560.1 hypothetical protein [Hyphomicrobiales bacterium]
MAYAADKSGLFNPVGNAGIEPQSRARHAVKFLRRVWNAISSWSSARDEAEIAALLERTGGRLTDSVEREMLQRRTNPWTAFY